MADHAHNLRASAAAGRPFGVITRGTTNHNRLRRCDRWMLAHPEISALLRHVDTPLALDVGYGASHATTVEWAGWLRRANPQVDVRGLGHGRICHATCVNSPPHQARARQPQRPLHGD